MVEFTGFEFRRVIKSSAKKCNDVIKAGFEIQRVKKNGKKVRWCEAGVCAAMCGKQDIEGDLRLCARVQLLLVLVIAASTTPRYSFY